MDEFSDVNSSEKSLLNLWNTFCYGIQGRSGVHLQHILTSFVDQHAHQIYSQNLLG
jgi:VEFS-Box of polycomb protein